ncbi:MAG: trigger factor [Paludibacteraceae bacterium]|nr:trigger factor [Paludibacteraceae bacterium]
MQINQSELKDLMAVVTLTLEPADYQEEVAKQLKQVRQKAQMPGFRPGMVPAGLVKKMYGKGILADVLNKLVGENLQKHIEENKLQVLGEPLPNDELTKNIDLDHEDTFTFAFDIAVAPEFDAKLNGKNKLPEYTIEPTEEMINKQVEAYTNRFGEYIPEDKEKGTKAEVKPCAVDAELFAKVYGAEAPKDEKAFRERIKEDIVRSLAEESKYRFGIDAKEAIMKKMEKVAFPEDFLKRWVLATNEKMTQEELDKDFPKMLDELKWQLAKDQLMKEYKIDVQKEEVEAFAKRIAKMQFMQYGLMNVEDEHLTSYAQEMLKNENQLRSIVERVVEDKLFEALKGVAKIEAKTVSQEDFDKLFK